ncbi:MAG: hypothetical protein AAF560_00580 [Acidobacteriota bacterium]
MNSPGTGPERVPRVPGDAPSGGVPSGGAPSGGAPSGGAPSSTLRGAFSSERPSSVTSAAWTLTLVLILGAGGLLYGLRSWVAPALDRWLPSLEAPQPVPVSDLPPPPVQDEPVAVEPEDPPWTYVDIESALMPLPAQTEDLIAAGLSELGELQGLDSSDETRALLARNRWRLWGRIWRNRVEKVRSQMPPLEDCAIHAALDPTCRAMAESLAVLGRVPDAQRLDDARQRFGEASQILEQLTEPEAEPETESEDSASGAGDS